MKKFFYLLAVLGFIVSFTTQGFARQSKTSGANSVLKTKLNSQKVYYKQHSRTGDKEILETLLEDINLW
ncbi:MAG TPA: hypothetical protein VMW66_01510, partial [Elusimicrobiales bacterium]|nr:hypothetical protein [Elusimicrobiales bacterium]